MDNLDISFAADKSAEEKGRINAVEDYLTLLTERIKFCLSGISGEVAGKSDGEEEKRLIYSAISDEVGEFSNTDKNCEVFNDYENNVAGAYYSHAEGHKTTANAPYSHAEGRETVAYNMHSHAEGYKTVAGGQSSHAEGEYCNATGSCAHAEGFRTVASGMESHASGLGTKAEGEATFAVGRWNKTTSALFVVGNGWNSSPDNESDASRSDALVLDGSGNLRIAGKLTADGGVEYSMPTATRYTLGGVVIGDNISVTADGVISVDLSEYLKSSEISDWAKADEKPKYTAADVGAATSADITVAVEAVSIGGRNIACGTKIMTPGANYTGNWNDGTWRSNKSWGVLSVVDITDSPVEGVTKAIRLTANKVENGCGVSQQFTPLVAGQQYVLSCWVRGTAPIAQISTYYSTPVKGRVAPFNITSQWQKVFVDCGNTEQYNVPTETKTYTASIVYIVPKNIGDYVEICGLKLEKGNKPTDWSPAPEDTDRRITSLEARVAALEAMAVSGGEV